MAHGARGRQALLDGSGWALAAAIRSCSDFQGESVGTTSTTGCEATSATGSRSVLALNGMLGSSEGLMARLAVCPMPKV
jgi:hypothetical protein